MVAAWLSLDIQDDEHDHLNYLFDTLSIYATTIREYTINPADADHGARSRGGIGERVGEGAGAGTFPNIIAVRGAGGSGGGEGIAGEGGEAGGGDGEAGGGAEAG